jgi:2-(1,2-epoxy-1,2-dihydrophenyl)acetyl-CoA isomerase
VGPYRARELLFDPRPVGADEAADLGLATRVVDAGEPFRESVAAYTREQLTAPAATLGRTKQLVDAAFEDTLDDHLEAQREAIVAASRREVFRERLAEFVGRENGE